MTLTSGQKYQLGTVVGLVVAIPLIVGVRLPYLYTSVSFSLRAFVLFPLLLLLGLYFGYFRKNRRGQTRMQVVAGRLSKWEAGKFALKFLLALPIMSALFAWLSPAYPACVAQLLKEPYAQSVARRYRVDGIRLWGGPLWSRVFELELIDSETGEIVELPLTRSRYEETHLQIGERVCAKGRMSVFGTIIDATSRDISSCSP
jgi:hypothetical protein